MLQLRATTRIVSLCDGGMQRRCAELVVWHDSTAFSAVFERNSDNMASFMNQHNINNTKLRYCILLPLVVLRMLIFLDKNLNGSPARVSL
jgi:hypothetical protein